MSGLACVCCITLLESFMAQVKGTDAKFNNVLLGPSMLQLTHCVIY